MSQWVCLSGGALSCALALASVCLDVRLRTAATNLKVCQSTIGPYILPPQVHNLLQHAYREPSAHIM